MPGKVLWDPKMKGFGCINMEFGIAWCYMTLNLPFSPEQHCNLAPFQSECTTWGAGSILPLRTPNVLFSENSLFLSEAVLGCCSGSPEPNNLPEQLGKAGASRLLQIHTWNENTCSPVLVRPPSLSSCGKSNCPTLNYTPSTSVTAPPAPHPAGPP